MITQRRWLSIGAVWSLAFFITAGAAAGAGTQLETRVDYVIDGDTVVISGGEKVRLVGIDAPEKGEPFARHSKQKLDKLAGRTVSLNLCQEKDIYGRALGVLSIKGENVNRTLLEEGLAVPMLIPPCGKSVASDVLAAAAQALMARKGIYSQASFEPVHHEDAGEHIGEPAVIRGRILSLHKGRNVWHLNFGKDWKTDFTAVLFREARFRFQALGLNPEDLVGLEVLVLGKVKEYNGPEIIIRGPEQIIPAGTVKN